MKDFITYFLVTTLVLISRETFAQGRPEKTSSTRAYYDYKTPKVKYKSKREKGKVYRHPKPARGTRARIDTPGPRRRS